MLFVIFYKQSTCMVIKYGSATKTKKESFLLLRAVLTVTLCACAKIKVLLFFKNQLTIQWAGWFYSTF